MLGLSDPTIIAAYLLCIISSVICVIYGAINWNKGEEIEVTSEDKEWAKEEDKIAEDL